MLALLYLPALAAAHFSAGAALGVMSVLSAKAVRDMRRAGRDADRDAERNGGGDAGGDRAPPA